MHRRVLITGVAGFIGYHLATRLLTDGLEVHGLDNMNDYYDPALKSMRLQRLRAHPHFTFQANDISDHEQVLQTFEDCHPDIVVHLAAQAGVRYSLEKPRAYVSANLDGFLAILEGCRRRAVRHLFYASSSSVYGTNIKVPFAEGDRVDSPASLYAVTKRSNELMAYAYSQLFKVPTTGLRFFTVYGPWGRPDMAYFKFTKAILEGRPIELYAPSVMRRDFTYIDDVIETVCRLLNAPLGPFSSSSSRIFNIGNDNPIDLQRFVAAIEAATNRKAQTKSLPMQPGDVPATWADLTSIRAATGYTPDTPIEDGIRRFVAWYLAFYGG